MILYSLTLQKATGIQCTVLGNFSTPKSQELVISRGKLLEIQKINEQGELELILQEEAFGMIRAMIPFRMTGSSRDLLVVGSDSGKLLLFELKARKLIVIHSETFGKSGCRRVVPGQFLAADPKGRAIMVGALEKQKFIYMLNRDAANRITISSPLEVHRNRTVLFDIVGVDVGFENPLFACLEVEYDDPVYIEKGMVLALYEVDLGLNHAVRSVYCAVHSSAHRLIPVPGIPDGPGGVLICEGRGLSYYQLTVKQPLHCAYPCRADISDDHGLFILNWAFLRQKEVFFFLIQSECGDIYKVSLTAKTLQIQYFDTIFPCVSLQIVKFGFLFAAAEHGNHALYQFISIGDNSEPVATSSDTVQSAYFMPRALSNLRKLYELTSYCSINDMKVLDLRNEGFPQIYVLCGKGPRSSLKVLKYGLGVSELAKSALPGKPTGIWALAPPERPQSKFIVISFLNATLILGVSERIAEVNNSGFDCTAATIHCNLLGNTYIQVTTFTIRSIFSTGNITRWESAAKIRTATSNARQLAVTVQGGLLIYFELDTAGALCETGRREIEQEVTCIDIAAVPTGRVRSRFLALGCFDHTVKILSLDPEGGLRRLAVQVLPNCRAVSIKLLEQLNGDQLELYLLVGLEDGTLLKTVVDGITGQLSDTRCRRLGEKPVSLYKTIVDGSQGALAVSNRTYVALNYLSKYVIAPLVYDSLDFVAPFVSGSHAESQIAVCGSTLRIFYLKNLGDIFNEDSVPLDYTAKKMEVNPITKELLIIESDNNAFSLEQRKMIRETIQYDLAGLSEAEIGVPQAGDGRWACCLRIVDSTTLKTSHRLELENNETAVSLCVTTFTGYESELFLVLGTVKDMLLAPRTHTGAFAYVFKLSSGLQFIHKTELEDIPLALCSFYGNLLVGVGPCLRVYALGKKKLLKKCENRTSFSNAISLIRVDEERIFASQLDESVTVLVWRREDNQLCTFADDVVAKWLVAGTVLDHDTIACIDKGENFSTLRLPAACEQDEADLLAVRHKWDAGFLNSAYYKLDQLNSFHIADMPTALSKAALSSNAEECLVYSTSMGALGAFLPLRHKAEVEFFVHLEMYMRQEGLGLLGRDHLSFRSAGLPVKDVIDGDLCEKFAQLPYSRQRTLAEALEHSPNEILKMLEELRIRII